MRRTSFVFAAVFLAACGGKKTPTDPGTQVVAAGIYVTTATNTVVVFPLNATGNVAPTRKIAGASTGLSLPIGVGLDSKGSLYVANRTGSRITVYPLGANGDVAPTRSLTDTAMKSPQGLYIAPNDAVFAVTCPSCGSAAGGATGMFHFSNGSNAIDYVIRGANTALTVPVGVGVDGTNNVYIGNAFGGSVNVYAPGAQGNTLPIRSFNPGSSQNVQSMQLSGNTITLSSPGAGILTYLNTAAAASPPASTIPSSATLPISYPGGVYLDTSVAQPVLYIVDYLGNAVYVAQTAGSAPNLTVTSVVTIKGALTGLTSPLGITVKH
jgi:hypothetical protein